MWGLPPRTCYFLLGVSNVMLAVHASQPHKSCSELFAMHVGVRVLPLAPQRNNRIESPSKQRPVQMALAEVACPSWLCWGNVPPEGASAS